MFAFEGFYRGRGLEFRLGSGPAKDSGVLWILNATIATNQLHEFLSI